MKFEFLEGLMFAIQHVYAIMDVAIQVACILDH